MNDSLLSHRHPHEHRHCTPRRQLVSIRQASGDDPEYVVNLDERRPVVVAAMRDVEDERHDTALRCLQERTLNVAAAEAERRPQQDQAASRRPAGFSQQGVSRRSHHDYGSSSMGPFNTYSADRQTAFGLPQMSPDRPLWSNAQSASRRSRRVSGGPCVRPSATSSAERRSQQDGSPLQDLSDQALGFSQPAVCRRHRQEARPVATYSGSQMPPASSNLRPDGHY
ncbi:hypothetical protein PYW08_000485 [Mythimna loreyi]|uniref:Uncharacterized protein n=1 Tax=Mythimna loreyi TaxID=667449 RepID=A0ACC2RCM5_9NEOP|nr:hypothetical protein PYW08_000485 [Mythimna loreyi]